ncbi:MAG: sterol desaturase family protein [Nonlabens sp.]
MEKYLDVFTDSFVGYANYLLNELLHPSWTNYFYWLLFLSLLVYSLELIFPWRKTQNAVRKDFWLDGFYLLFNFFLLSLIGFNAVADVGVALFNDLLLSVGITNLVSISLATLPAWPQLLTMFILADFMQWNIHRLLHRVPWLWNFHKVHHSVLEMGFAAQFRFHFMESIVYKTLQYVPLAMIGFGIDQFIIIHIIAILIGHLNHANLDLDYGPLKYLLNNPKMHLWHHSKVIPNNQKYGVNYGLSLSLWDYLFGTAHVPYHDPDLELGFPGVESFPDQFHTQLVVPFKNNSS